MKFGRYLREQAIAEWRRAYINYRALKKQIGKAEAELEAQDEEEQDLLPSRSETMTRRRSTRVDDMDGGAGEPSSSPHSPPPVRTKDAAPQTVASPLSSDFSHAFSDSTQGTDSPLKRQMSRASVASNSSATGGLLKRLQMRRSESFITKSGDFNPKKWRAGYSARLSLRELYDAVPPASRKFFAILDRELDKVDTFYQDRESEAIKRFEELSVQWKELADHKKEFQAFRAREMNVPSVLQPIVPRVQLPGSNAVRRTFAGRAPRDEAQSTHESDAAHGSACYKHGSPQDYTTARSKLKLATFEYYRSLGMLKSFRVLNRTGFAKSLKKYEKGTKIPCTTAYTPKVDKAHFVSSTRLDELIRETEDAFATVFEGGDRKRALERLRDFGQHKMHHFTAWRAGMLMGIALPLMIEGIVLSSQASTRASIPYWQPLLQLFGAMYLPVIFSLLFYLNLVAWSAARINFVLIFELDVRTRMDTHQFIEIPALLFCILSLFFWLAFHNFWPDHIAPYSYPLAFFVVAMILLLMPFQFLYPSARWWMVRSFCRVITAGLIRVEFRDFFLGDELNSLYYPIVNLGLIVCAYNHGWPSNTGQICSTNGTWATPVLASLPAAWRLGQSLRRYLDSDGLAIHMMNAGKYSASILQFFLYYSWRIYGSNSNARKGVWIASAIVNSLYTGGWDIVMDWSLLRRKSKHFLLRSELGFFKDQYWMYYFAIVLDILLRFAWVLYLAPSPSVTLKGYLLAVLEVIRRIIWNGFRVESEHIGNVDGYRVTRNVPLPYATATPVEPRDPSLELDLAGPQTLRQRFFSTVHSLHEGIVRDLGPIALWDLGFLTKARSRRDSNASGVVADDGETAGAGRDEGWERRRRASKVKKQKSRGTAPESSSDDDDALEAEEEEEQSDSDEELQEVEEDVEDAQKMMRTAQEGEDLTLRAGH